MGSADRKALLWAALLALAFGAAAFAGVELSRKADSTAALWPPNAILLAALLISARSRWPLLLIGAGVGSLLANLLTDHPLSSSLVVTVANVAEAYLAAWLLAAWAGRVPLLESVAGVTKLVLVAGLIAPAFAATLATVGLALLGSGVSDVWARWFAGDALGLLIVTPMLLSLHGLLRDGRSALLNGRSGLEAGVLLAGIAAMAVAVFSTSGIPLLFLLVPLVLLATFRLGTFGAAASTVIVASIAFWATAHDSGPAMLFVGTDGERIFFLQIFLGVLFATSLPVAAALAERQALTVELRVARDAARRAAEDLYDMATTDELTGLASRRHFLARCAEEIAAADRTGRPLTFALIDVDRFKSINDTHGHLSGDDVLRAIGAACRGIVRTGEIVGRLGGEEFGLLMPGASLEQARIACERLRTRVAGDPIQTRDGAAIEVSVSIGAAQLVGSDQHRLFTEADRALYAAKQRGRNVTVLAA